MDDAPRLNNVTMGSFGLFGYDTYQPDMFCRVISLFRLLASCILPAAINAIGDATGCTSANATYAELEVPRRNDDAYTDNPNGVAGLMGRPAFEVDRVGAKMPQENENWSYSDFVPNFITRVDAMLEESGY